MDYGNDEVLRRCHNHVPVQKFVTLTMGEIIRYGWIRLLEKNV